MLTSQNRRMSRDEEAEFQISPTPQSGHVLRKSSFRCRRRRSQDTCWGSRVSDVADAAVRTRDEEGDSLTHHIRRSSFSRCYLAQLPASVFVPIIKEDKEKSIQRMVIIISVTYLTIYYEWIFIKLDPWSIWGRQTHILLCFRYCKLEFTAQSLGGK